MIGHLEFKQMGENVLTHLPYSAQDLNLYQRLIQYFAVVAEAGGTYLDMVNFNKDTYPEVVSLQESEGLFCPEHGYASPDGVPELRTLLIAYEMARAKRYSNYLNIVTELDFYKMGTGIGAGTTGVMNCLLPAIRDVSGRKSPTIALSVPLYSIYDGMAVEHGLKPLYLRTQPELGFLPTPAEVAEILEFNPVALVLTYPSNPAQTTYGLDRVSDLQQIVRLCQEKETFLVVDNIYQDTLWENNALNPEILALTAQSDFIVKVTGPSKDRPGCSGWRIGHWVGDRRLQEKFFYYTSIQYNTPNSVSRCALALDMLMRMARIHGRTLLLDDFDLLGDFVAGWNRRIDRNRLFEMISDLRLEEKWYSRLMNVETKQKNSLQNILCIAKESGLFSEIVNEQIGNLVLLRVSPDVFSGTDHELFLYLMEKSRLGILPANAFGFPIKLGQAWFRVTTIHKDPNAVAEQFRLLVKTLKYK